AEPIDDAAIERQLRSDDGEIDRVALGKRQQQFRIARIDRRELGHRRDAGVARRAEERGHAGLARELPGEGVLAPAATRHQHPHERPNSFIRIELRELILNWKPYIPVIAYCIPTVPKGPYRATWSHRATADPPAGGG